MPENHRRGDLATKRDNTTRPRARSVATNRRTTAQLERQARVFELNVVRGMAYRAIAALERIGVNTVTADMRYESARRSSELGLRRGYELDRALTFYDGILQRAMDRADAYDDRLRIAPELVKYADDSLSVALSARTRIDKLLGLEAPTKIDLGMQALIDALEPKDDPITVTAL